MFAQAAGHVRQTPAETLVQNGVLRIGAMLEGGEEMGEERRDASGALLRGDDDFRRQMEAAVADFPQFRRPSELMIHTAARASPAAPATHLRGERAAAEKKKRVNEFVYAS